MDPITLFFIITGVATLGDKIIGDIFKSANGNKIKARLDKLSQSISKNSQLDQQLTEAFNRKDMNLANSILSASPFGGSVHILRDQAKQLKKDYDKNKDIIQKEEARLLEEQNRLNDIQNNIGGGIVGGIYGTAELNKGTSESSQAYKDLVNGGITNFENKTYSSDLLGPQKLNTNKRSTS